MSDFSHAVQVLLKEEGSGYVPEDNGRGASKYGVTLATYREFFPQATAEDIAGLTPDAAGEFYRRAFWDRYHLGRIEDQALATKMLNLAANLGGGTAVKLLQRAVGVRADGAMGTETAAAVNALDPEMALRGLRVQAEGYYRALVERKPGLSGNLKGWLIRLAG